MNAQKSNNYEMIAIDRVQIYLEVDAFAAHASPFMGYTVAIVINRVSSRQEKTLKHFVSGHTLKNLKF